VERGLRSVLAVLGAAALFASLAAAETPVVAFPRTSSPEDWTALLAKYVDERGLVAYARWKNDAGDRRRLAAVLAAARDAGPEPSPDAKLALLINSYNAFIVETILERYPVDSIRSIPGAFTAETHPFGGRLCSLDEIEHAAVALGGYRAHAAMVCASRSCPPLGRRAFTPDGLSARLDERMRAWLSRNDLWQFDPAKNLVRAPRYLDWYRADFERAGVARVLAAYAPAEFGPWLARGGFRVEYLGYDWALNDRTAGSGGE
jgi:hypothetical protein